MTLVCHGTGFSIIARRVLRVVMSTKCLLLTQIAHSRDGWYAERCPTNQRIGIVARCTQVSTGRSGMAIVLAFALLAEMGENAGRGFNCSHAVSCENMH